MLYWKERISLTTAAAPPAAKVANQVYERQPTQSRRGVITHQKQVSTGLTPGLRAVLFTARHYVCQTEIL